ncbi:hypothetical protein A0J61_11628, partial [Choanephora cucurbitarum]
MDQVFVIDATYKTNDRNMPLICVYGVHNLGADVLRTFPVAFAFVCDEQQVTYIWFMETLKNALGNTHLEQPVFVTDKCLALMEALETVFPESDKLLCIWHMMGNIKKELSKNGRFFDKKIKEEAIKLLAQFSCLSTQRAESGHRILKVGLSRRLDLISAFENIDAYCSLLKQKLALLEQKETQKQDLLMRRNNRLNRVRGKVSRAALIAAHSVCIAVESGEVARENGDE